MNILKAESLPALTTEDLMGNLTVDQIDRLNGNLFTSSLTLANISPYWNQSTYSIDTTLNASKVNIGSFGIEMANECDVKIGDFSLKESLERIEKQLGILQVNPELEKDWEELKELGERYRELEKNIHDKMKVWKILKND